jgi:PadR family transcriptional regulator PadR
MSRGAVKDDLLQGTLDLLVLKALSIAPMHGWGVAQRLQLISREVLQVNQGSLYPALHRLERKGFIDSEWRASENNRRARYYRITAKGSRALEDETESWVRFAGAVQRVLRTT